MKPLRYIIIFKIGFTIVFWCIPLILFPKSCFIKLGIPVSETLLFLRFLGVAYLALVIGYIGGLIEIRRDKKPFQAVWVGIWSNGLACAVLLYYGLTGEWATWQMPAPILLWASAFVTFWLALLLFLYRPA